MEVITRGIQKIRLILSTLDLFGEYGGWEMQIFLSFAYDEDIDGVNGFRGMLENPNANINFVDGSCKKDYGEQSEAEIDRYIRSLVDQSSVTVCLISAKTRSSQWVDRELKISQSKGKGIAGIILKGKENEISSYSDCPQIFHGQRYKVYYWDKPETMRDWIKEAERRR